MFKTVPIIIFSLIPLLLILLFVTVASMDGVDSELEEFPAPAAMIDANQIEIAYVAPLRFEELSA